MAKRKTLPPEASSLQPDLTHIAEGLRPLAVPLVELVPDPVNARKHDAKNLRSIASSLATYGQRTPLVVNKRNQQIEKGNGTYQAAQSLGWTHLAVVFVEDDPSAQRGYSIADNRTAELAAWDDTMLAGIIADLTQETPELADALLLSDLLKAPSDKGLAARLDRYQVLVDCRDKRDQQALNKELQRKGYATRKVTSVATPAPEPAETISPEIPAS